MSGNSGLRRFVTSSGSASPDTARLDTASLDTASLDTASPGTGGQPPSSRPADSGPGLTGSVGLADRAESSADVEKCELCATEIPAVHSHVADLEHSSLMCACRACYLLFTHSEAGRGKYRAIPDRYLTDPVHPLSVREWDTLEVPVGLAFFMNDSRQGEVIGFYPSPAGATQCELDLQAWQLLAEDHPLLSAMAPDVEAVLISRAESVVECFVVPIDACYELAGRMRLLWRGFDGGEQARASISDFLASVRGRARTFGPGA